MKFMNIARRFGAYQNPVDPAAPNPGQAPAPAPAPAPNPSPEPQSGGMTAEQINQILSAFRQQNVPPRRDEYADHLKADEERKKQAKALADTEAAIKFNSTFGDLLSKNKALFPDRTMSLLAKSYASETEKAESMQKFAARDFFSKQENIALLSDHQKMLVQQKLINEHSEISMTSAEAWGLVEAALHVHQVKQDEQKRSGLYNQDASGEMSANLKAFHESMYPKKVTSL